MTGSSKHLILICLNNYCIDNFMSVSWFIELNFESYSTVIFYSSSLLHLDENVAQTFHICVIKIYMSYKRKVIS